MRDATTLASWLSSPRGGESLPVGYPEFLAAVKSRIVAARSVLAPNETYPQPWQQE